MNEESRCKQYRKSSMVIFPKVVTPECFYRGSSQSFAWIPAKSMRE
jgi:hypothetical protein